LYFQTRIEFVSTGVRDREKKKGRGGLPFYQYWLKLSRAAKPPIEERRGKKKRNKKKDLSSLSCSPNIAYAYHFDAEDKEEEEGKKKKKCGYL